MVGTIEADVAIVGGGPSGLAAAAALRRCGVGRVLVLEREGAPGGATRHCAHPPFGLREFGRVLTGPRYARRLAQAAVEAGAELRLRHTVVALVAGGRLELATPEGRRDVRARRVLIATGAREATRAARLLAGERPLGVINTGALQAQVHLHNSRPFLRPVVVGSELVAISALWTCLSHGIRPAALLAGDDPQAVRWPLGLWPRALGVETHYGARILSVRGAPRVQSVEFEDAAGRRRSLDSDGVLLTGGWTPETALARAAGWPLDPSEASGLDVDQYGRCADPAFFAAGNVLRGIETAGWCWREGRRVAGLIADDLAGRLPAADRTRPIRRGAGVALISPQRLAFPLYGSSRATPLQLRASKRMAGRLVVRGDGRELWARSGRFAPHRRILAPLDWAESAEGCGDLVIDLE